MVKISTLLKEKDKTPTQLPMGIIVGLLNYTHASGDRNTEKCRNNVGNGWLRMKEIIDTKKNPLWHSQVTNFPKAVMNLIDLGMVEESTEEDLDNRGYRKFQYKIWRLKKDYATFSKVKEYCFSYDIWLLTPKYYDEIKGKGTIKQHLTFYNTFENSDYKKLSDPEFAKKYFEVKSRQVRGYMEKRAVKHYAEAVYSVQNLKNLGFDLNDLNKKIEMEVNGK